MNDILEKVSSNKVGINEILLIFKARNLLLYNRDRMKYTLRTKSDNNKDMLKEA